MNSEEFKHQLISKIFSKLIKENCFGCAHKCFSQKDHNVCLDDEVMSYYWKLAEEMFSKLAKEPVIKEEQL